MSKFPHTRSKEEIAFDLEKAEARRKNKLKYKLLERTDLPLAKRHVNMSNVIARSCQSLNLIEKRAIALSLAKTDSVPVRDLILAKERGWTIKITAAEYSEQYNVSSDVAYFQLQSAKSITERQLRYFMEDHKGTKEVTINWVGQYIYHKGEGWAEISFTPQIAPHLLGLRGDKTPFISNQLGNTQDFKSNYTWSIHDCLLSWKLKGRWEPTIEEFCYTLNLPGSYSKDFGAIRKRIIDPSVNELNLKSNITVTYETVNSGRKVTGLIFKFKVNN